MNFAHKTGSFGATDIVTARDWKKALAAYRKPDIKMSITEIVVTVVPLVALWVAAWLSLSVSYWLSLVFIVPASGLIVRLFLIQHDCGHGAFFKKRNTNDWTGRVLGVFTFTPYDVWRLSHARHHSGSGNLDHRGTGDIETLTVSEYRALTWWGRFLYRAYRHPIVMFGIGPAYIFLLQQRLPVGQMTGEGWRPWLSSMGTNLGIALFAGAVIWFVGVEAFLLIHLPIIVLGATIGVWLFYIQHQFEDTYWEESKKWTHDEAALYGSSHYDLPPVLRWFTANIGVHHVHHLYSRIPFYRLQQVLRDYPELASIRRITLWESFKYVNLQLWSQDLQQMISFRDLHKAQA